MKKLIIKPREQLAHLYEDDHHLKTYVISTAKNGISCANNSYCTPDGVLRVAQKIGDGEPIGTIFRARKPTGNFYGNTECGPDEDLVLTRILWLEGTEEKNLNTIGRYIYLHRTNQEHLLGTAASHGCIRFSNQDIIEIFDELPVGAEVIVEA